MRILALSAALIIVLAGLAAGAALSLPGSPVSGAGLGGALSRDDWLAHLPLAVVMALLVVAVDAAFVARIHLDKSRHRVMVIDPPARGVPSVSSPGSSISLPGLSTSSALASSLKGFAAIRRVPARIVAITALASGALLMGGLVMQYPLYLIGPAVVLPWLPLLFFEFLWKYEHYNWLAIFAVVTVLQVGHIAEHTVQVTQLAVLHGTLACPPPADSAANAARAVELGLRSPDQPATGLLAAEVVQPNPAHGFPIRDGYGRVTVGVPACGVFGQLDFESVHLVWDTLVWIGALWLLLKFPGNRWLRVAMIAASLHEVEHLFLGWIFFMEPEPIFTYGRQLWATTVQGSLVTAHPVGLAPQLANFYDVGGKIGLLGRNGLAEAIFSTRNVLPIRPYLHFGYNTLVVLPTVLAFLMQVRQVYDEYLARALPHLTEEQLVRATPKLETLRFAPGAIIVRQGEPADRLYILTKGWAEMVCENAREPVVTWLAKGHCFGDAGLLNGGKHHATVRATTRVEILALDAATFKALMAEGEEKQS
jgi:hypothetical protein